MTLRRALLSLFLLASGALPAAAELSPKAWQPKSGDVISFNVLREGKPFGSHAVKSSPVRAPAGPPPQPPAKTSGRPSAVVRPGR